MVLPRMDPQERSIYEEAAIDEPQHHEMKDEEEERAGDRRKECDGEPICNNPHQSIFSIHLIAAATGNALEYFDFSTYAFFAPEIGKLFFPEGSPSIQAIKTFSVFAAGFMMRPIGSLLLGAVGDKYGTATALRWSIFLMTVPTVLTGCLPTYAHVGYIAPILLTCLRLIQGLSVGGEFIGAILHTSDHTPSKYRGFYCGAVAVFGTMGNLLGSILSVIMRKTLAHEDLLAWGWRIPFLTGSILGFVGIFLRSSTAGGLSNPITATPATSTTATAATTTSVNIRNTAAATTTVTSAAVGDRDGPIQGNDAVQQHQQAKQGIDATTTTTTVTTSPSRYRLAASSLDLPAPLLPPPPPSKNPSTTITESKKNSFYYIMQHAAATDKRRFLDIILSSASNNSQFYFHFVWLGTYLSTLAPHPIDDASAFTMSCISMSVLIIAAPLWAWCGDLRGNRIDWVIVNIGTGGIAAPFLFLLLLPGQVEICYLYAVLLGLVMGFSLSGNYLAWLTQTMHHSPARYVTTSVAYNLGAMLGGTYPLFASALTTYPNIPLLPILPISGWALMVALYLLKHRRYELHDLSTYPRLDEEEEEKQLMIDASLQEVLVLPTLPPALGSNSSSSVTASCSYISPKATEQETYVAQVVG